MRYLLPLILSVALLGCEGVIEVGDPQELFTTPGDIADVESLDGAKLYETNCAACHGANAEGTPVWSAPIIGYSPIAPIVEAGRGSMAPMALSAAEVDQIQAFLTAMAEPVETSDGAGLYDRYCGSCHGPEGLGSDIWTGSIQGYAPIDSIVLDGRGEMPAIPIEPEQMTSIQDYLANLGTPADELDDEGLYTRYCGSCHGADASGGDNWPGSIQGYAPIESIVVDGRGEMDAVDLSAEQTAMIQEWLLTLAPALDTLTGPEVYERLCVTCHGEQGAGIDGVGPQLRYDDDPYSTFWTRNGRSTTRFDSDMPDYPSDMISDTQLEELFDWLNETPRPTTAEGLYAQYCANCHGADGSGGPSQKPIAGDNEVREVVREGKGSGSFARRTNYMTGWGITQVSDTELSMIEAYVGGL